MYRLNIKEELRHAKVSNQEIRLRDNLSKGEVQQIANYLQFHMNNGTIPHWRPIAWTYHHNEGVFMKQLTKSCPLLGDRCQEIADRFASKTPVGSFYRPPKESWGYTQVGDISQMDNSWADVFGFNGNITNGVGKTIKVRRRDILTCKAEECNISFSRYIVSPTEDTHYTLGYYDIPTTADKKEDETLGIPTERIKPIAGLNTAYHSYYPGRLGLMNVYGLGDIRPVFILLFKLGTGYKTSAQNSITVIPELRDSFAFCYTDYSFANLVRVDSIHNNIISLEFYEPDYHENQFEAMLKNL